MKTSYIYKIENLKNGKVYIGKTNNYKARRSMHLSCIKNKTLVLLNSKFKEDVLKYNVEDWHISLIEECPESVVFIRETRYIILYNSIKNGYNVVLVDKKQPKIAC